VQPFKPNRFEGFFCFGSFFKGCGIVSGKRGAAESVVQAILDIIPETRKKDDADSWMSILTKAGFVCVPILKGTAEYDNFVDIWVSHLEAVLKHLNLGASAQLE
jgi:hypothetical protein